MTSTKPSLFDAALINQATVDAFKKLHPRDQLRNPVMLVVLLVK